MANDSTTSEQPPPVSPSSDPSLSRNSSFNSRLNAHAPEFVPRTPTPTPTPTTPHPPHFSVPPPPPPILRLYAPSQPPFHAPFHVISPVHPHHHHNNSHYLHHQQQPQSQDPRRHSQNHHHQRSSAKREGDQQKQQLPDDVDLINHSKKDHDRNNLAEDSARKILNQVEYYFSDLNLATTDHLMRYSNKDPEGYVPISVVASFKKIKSFISSNSHLATILKNSTKLVVSEDGKKVKRQQPLTESDMEELQSRIVVAENLPEDHCHQNLMKIFSAVGSVKTIRTCQPQPSGGGSSALRTGKSDNVHFSNKLHAFVEYESVELAEKAVAELNEEDNWRIGLRVHLMFRRTEKPAQTRERKGNDDEGQCEEEDASSSDQVANEKQLEDTSQQSDFNNSREHLGDEYVNEKEGGPRKGRSKGRAKGRVSGRAQNSHSNNHPHSNNRRNHLGMAPSNNMVSNEQSVIGKQPPGPCMPDGTRGFSIGRGKPIAANVA